MPNLIDLTDKVYGRLTVIYLLPRVNGKLYWQCQCSCGKECSVDGAHLRGGTTKSCGCLHKEISRNATHRRTHGARSGRKQTKEYTAWCGMRARCKDKSDLKYGGRGIKVCDRWQSSFEDFLSDMGPAPSIHHSIDRIKNNGDYEPGNCRWATAIEQQNNTRKNLVLLYKGEAKSLTQWCRDLGLSESNYHRIRCRGVANFAHPFKNLTRS